MSKLFARVQRVRLAKEHAEAVDRALRESKAPPHHRSAPADEARLRGIPAIGKGVQGHVPGTHPEQQAMRRRVREVVD